MSTERADKSLTAVTRNTSGLKRGGPGRKAGVPNKATVAVKELARGLVEDPDYLDRLKARLNRGKLAPAVEAMLWNYAFGKPKETVEVTGANGGPIVTQIARVIVDPNAGD